MYEFRAVEGRGTATFATEDIPRGTIIMNEEPMLALVAREGEQAGENPLDIYSRWVGLSPDDKKTYLTLAESPEYTNMVKRNLQEQYGRYDLTRPFWAKVVRVAAIYYTNTFEAVTAAPIDSAVYRNQSRLNHSCMNNTMQGSQENGSQQMQVVRDVVAGEELTVPYIRLSGEREWRHERLAKYGFECVCPLCQFEDIFDNKNDSGEERVVGVEETVEFLCFWFDMVVENPDEAIRHQTAVAKVGIDHRDAEMHFLIARRLLEGHLAEGPAAEAELTRTNIQVIDNYLSDLRHYRLADDEAAAFYG